MTQKEAEKIIRMETPIRNITQIIETVSFFEFIERADDITLKYRVYKETGTVYKL